METRERSTKIMDIADHDLSVADLKKEVLDLSETLGHVFRLLKGDTYSLVSGTCARAINDQCVLVKDSDGQSRDSYFVLPTETYTLSPHYHDNKHVRLDHDKGLCREVHGKAQ